MTQFLTRRSLIAGAAALAAAPQAFAAEQLAFPLRLACARLGPQGFIHMRGDDLQAWETLAVRTGGLIAEIEPLQPSSMLGARAPALDGGASCALAARRMATDAGFELVILYAVDANGHGGKDGWLNDCFASVRAAGGHGAVGEAHLLSIDGGAPLVSATAEARGKSWLNPLSYGRHPERDTLAALTASLERRIQSRAARQFELHRSIAD